MQHAGIPCWAITVGLITAGAPSLLYQVVLPTHFLVYIFSNSPSLCDYAAHKDLWPSGALKNLLLIHKKSIYTLILTVNYFKRLSTCLRKL